jgi:hypothetical protein
VNVRILLVAIISFWFAGSVFAMTDKDSNSSDKQMWELYSWQDAKGAWKFSLLPNKSNLYTHEDIIAPDRMIDGVEALEGAIAKLPRGSEIVWLPWSASPTGEKKYPSTDILMRISDFAKKHEIELKRFNGAGT